MKNRILSLTVLSLLFVIQPRIYAQLSFQVDSVSLFTLSDYSAELSSDDVIDESYETTLVRGPHIRIYGRLVNSSPDPIVYYASGEKALLTEPVIKTAFKYRGQNYETDHCCSKIGDVFFPVSNDSKWSQLYCTQIGGDEVMFFSLPGNSSTEFVFGSSFLYYSKWCDLKLITNSGDREHNIKNNRKLEKIAKKALQSILVRIEIKNHWDKWSKLLVEGSHVCNE